MTNIRMLVNPMAGAGTAGTHARDIAEGLRQQGFSVDVLTTSSPEEATELAAEAGAGDIIAPLGGDGMIALTARGLLASGATMLPLPAGRGNDFIRSLGLPRDTARVVAALKDDDELLRQQTKAIDVGFAGDIPFLGVASIGFDAEANYRANSYRRMRGGLVYTLAGAVTLATVRQPTYLLETDDDTQRVPAWNIAIGNSGRHGGGQRVCPDALLADGELDVVTFSGRRISFALAALKMRSGTHVKLHDVDASRTKRLRISTVLGDGKGQSSYPTPVYADGDQIGTLPMEFTIAPQALNVLVPLTDS